MKKVTSRKNNNNKLYVVFFIQLIKNFIQLIN